MKEQARRSSPAPRAPGAMRRALPWFTVAAGTIMVDQVTKLWAQLGLELHQSVHVAPGIALTLTYNEGAAFSLLSDAGGWQRWLFAAVAFGVSAFLIRWLLGLPRGLKWMPCAIALVLGGAIGNLYDRLVLGKVVDFIDLYYGRLHWPAFNVADSAICIGAVMLVVGILRGDDRLAEPG